MFKRNLFSEKHEAFGKRARRFIAEQVTPFDRQWEDAGEVRGELWRAAGEAGLLSIGRAHADARIVRIAAGAIEVTQHVIGRDLMASRAAA